MDQGIIAAVKCRYKSKLLEKLVIDGVHGNVNILDAMLIVKDVWDNLSAQTILSCWRTSRCLTVNLMNHDVFTDYRKVVRNEVLEDICTMFKSIDIESCDLIHNEVKNNSSTIKEYFSNWIDLEYNSEIMLTSDDNEVI